jgi:Ubiquitin family
MKITVSDQTGRQFPIEIDRTDNIFQLKGKVARVSGGGNVHQMKILFNGKELDNFSNFVQNQIDEGATLTVQFPSTGVQNSAPIQQQQRAADPFAAFGGGPRQQQPARAPQQATGMNFMKNPALVQHVTQLRDSIVNDSGKLSNLLEKDPELAQALLSDSIEDSVQLVGTRVISLNPGS